MPRYRGTLIAVHDLGLLQNGETVDTLKANCFPLLTRPRFVGNAQERTVPRNHINFA